MHESRWRTAAGGARIDDMRSALDTRRLCLRVFTPADAAELHELFRDPLTHTIGTGPYASIAQTEQWIARRMDAQRDHGLCWYALRDRPAGVLVGNCGLLCGRGSWSEPEIGYLIGHAWRRQGLATEATIAVLAECRRAGFPRIWASIRPDNGPSQRIAERTGMRLHHRAVDARGDLLLYVADLDAGQTLR
jgi:RimJ/RimL family protein N-acetyltransferase